MSAEHGHGTNLFVGSEGGGRSAAIAYTLIESAKLNGINPQAWLTDVLERMVSDRAKTNELQRLLPWNWKVERLAAVADA